MSMTNLTIRVDAGLKTQAAAVAEYYGFDLSSVTRAFYKQMVRENSIPLSLSCSYDAIPYDSENEAVNQIDLLSMETISHAR